MSEQLKCDHCGETGRETDVVDWLRVERIGITTHVLGQWSGPWHFDSSRCLGEWVLSSVGASWMTLTRPVTEGEIIG